MGELIVGLKIDVPGAEMIEHIRARQTYHAAKVEGYTAQVAGLTEAIEGAQFSGDPREGLKSKVHEHMNKAAHFKFIADHLSADAIYRLDERDLLLIEVIVNRW